MKSPQIIMELKKHLANYYGGNNVATQLTLQNDIFHEYIYLGHQKTDYGDFKTKSYCMHNNSKQK